MSESVTYVLTYAESFAVLTVETPELDIEHEDSITLDVQERELVFTAPPYHVRIKVEKDLLQAEVYPAKIDYEKCSITYHIPLRTETHADAEQVRGNFPYGFCNLYSGILNIQNSQDFKTLPNPEQFSNDERRKTRLVDEQRAFSAEHYGMDHVQYIIDGFGLDSVHVPRELLLTEDQRYRIKLIVDEKKRDLEKYEQLSNKNSTVANLLDIVLAVLYDKLTNYNELNEAISHVNIHRISATLSYFEVFQSLEDVLTAFYRRCCIYPLHRNKNLARTCVQIITDSLKQEKCDEWILEKLLYCYDAFKANDCVVLNHYFIKDYIRLIQICPPIEKLREAGSTMSKLLSQIHDRTFGFGEDSVIRKFIKEITGADEEVTDSDDTSGSDEDDGTEPDDGTSDEEDVVLSSEESVLDKLMNLKIQA